MVKRLPCQAGQLQWGALQGNDSGGLCRAMTGALCVAMTVGSLRGNDGEGSLRGNDGEGSLRGNDSGFFAWQ